MMVASLVVRLSCAQSLDTKAVRMRIRSASMSDDTEGATAPTEDDAGVWDD